MSKCLPTKQVFRESCLLKGEIYLSQMTERFFSSAEYATVIIPHLGNYNTSPALFQIQNARCVRVYILPPSIFKYMKILVSPTVIYRVVFFHCFNLHKTLFLSLSRLQYRDWLIIIEKPTNKACCWIVPLQVFSLLSSHQPPS